MFKKGDKVIIKRHGYYCDDNCDEPCVGEICEIEGFEISNRIRVRFICDGDNCANFIEKDLKLYERVKKKIKQFGIVKFLDSLNKKEEVNV